MSETISNRTNFKELKKLLLDKNNQKVFLITGNNSFIKSGAKRIFDKILSKDLTKIYLKKFPNPEIKELQLIIKELIKYQPDVILAIGGGSVIDYAKLANVLYNQKNLITNILKNSYKIKKKFTRLIAIPTTAGAGAEETCFSTIYINKIKFSVQSRHMKPDIVYIVPELIFNCGKKIKASSGFDAISQAIESLLSRNSSLSSVKYATKSLQYSLKYYLKYLKNPSINNSYYMALGANFSGKAINISKTNGPHALSYPFTANFGVNHGHAVSLTLNSFLKFNYQYQKNSDCDFDLKKRFKIIFELTKTNSIQSLDRYLLDLKKKASLEQDYLKLGVNIKRDYPKIISQINIQRLSNNPIKLDKEIIKKILFKEI